MQGQGLPKAACGRGPSVRRRHLQGSLSPARRSPRPTLPPSLAPPHPTPAPARPQGDGSCVTVEPGLILGEVNKLLAAHAKKGGHPIQYKMGPDPSSIDSCMIGAPRAGRAWAGRLSAGRRAWRATCGSRGALLQRGTRGTRSRRLIPFPPPFPLSPAPRRRGVQQQQRHVLRRVPELVPHAEGHARRDGGRHRARHRRPRQPRVLPAGAPGMGGEWWGKEGSGAGDGAKRLAAQGAARQHVQCAALCAMIKPGPPPLARGTPAVPPPAVRRRVGAGAARAGGPRADQPHPAQVCDQVHHRCARRRFRPPAATRTREHTPSAASCAPRLLAGPQLVAACGCRGRRRPAARFEAC